MIGEKTLKPYKACEGSDAGEILRQPVTYKEVYAILRDSSGKGKDISEVQKLWRASSLGCAALRMEVTEKAADGTVVVDSIHQAISLSFESVDKYFEIPTGYAEVTPSQWTEALYNAHPERFAEPPTLNPGPDANYKIMHDAIGKPGAFNIH